MAGTTVPLLDLSREYRAIAPLLHEAVERVLSQQRFILGEEVAAFERAAAIRCGARHAIGCASGTDALWLALTALGIGPGDAVVTTPFSFFATASSILRAGAQPVFADIDPETFNLAPEKVRACLESRSGSDSGSGMGASSPIRAILGVHLYGQTADWDGLTALKREFGGKDGGGLALVEDAAQAFGARWNGQAAGSLGEAAAFSFYPTKNLGAAGDAGLVTAAGDDVAGRLRMLRVHGMRRRYHHEEIGWNSRLDTLQAAILLVKLRFIDQWNEQRRALASNYDALFREAGLVDRGPYPERGVALPATLAQATHVFHQYVIRARSRDALKTFLEERGVGSEIYYPLPLHLQPALQGLGYRAGDFPESERAAREALAVPIFPQLTLEEQKSVVGAVADFFNSRSSVLSSQVSRR